MNRSTKGAVMQKISLISLFFIFFIFLSVNAAGCSYREMDDEELKILHEKTFQIAPGNLFTLEASSGDVLITTWDKSEVYIKVLGNDKAKEKVEFNFTGDQKEVKVTAKREGNTFNWFSKGISLRFEVKVPKQFNNTVNTSGGDIRMADVEGTTNIRTSGGDISLKRLTGNLRAGTSGGDINVENTSGDINVSTSGGDITGIDFKGDIEATTSGGDIQLKGSDSRIEAETSGGDVDLIYTGENKGISLSSSGGDITANVPADFNAYAKFSTSGGDVSCNLSTNNVVKISSSRFEADLNKGGNSFTVKTSGGDITVRKK